MKKIFFIVGGLFLAAGAALLVQKDPGYLLLGYGTLSVETSLAIALIAIVILFSTLYLLIRSFIYFVNTPSRFRLWGAQRRKNRSQKELTSGLIQSAEGHWEKAEKYLIKHAEESDTPLLNYLTAARAAQFRQDYGSRDRYLQLAHKSVPKADIAIGITQAELQLEHDQLEEALATLKHLKALSPKHPYILRLLSGVYQKLDEWEMLQKFLPTLKKFKAYNQADFLNLEKTVWINIFRKQADSSSAANLQQNWKLLPKALQKDFDLQNIYFNAMIKAGAGEDIERLLRASIDSEWNEELIPLYGQIEMTNQTVQIENAEKWLSHQPNNAVLLRMLGRLCARNQLWAKAEAYLEASIHSKPTVKALKQLGDLYNQHGNEAKAADCFKRALALATGEKLIEAPVPAKTEEPTVSADTVAI
jgi:HemY protein